MSVLIYILMAIFAIILYSLVIYASRYFGIEVENRWLVLAILFVLFVIMYWIDSLTPT